MTRRSFAAVLAAAAILPGQLGAQAADPVKPEMPRKDCTKRFIDPPSDAYGPPQAAAGAAAGQLKAPGLDIIGGYFRTTDTAVQMFIEVDDVNATLPSSDPGYRYSFEFKYGSTTFTAHKIHANPAYGAALFGNTDPPSVNPGKNDQTGGVDFDADVVWVNIPRATFEEKAGIPLEEGGKFEAIKFTTYWMVNTGAAPQKADEIAPAAAAATWNVFDDYCFGMPPAVLSDLKVKNVQYGDATTMSVKMMSDAGTALAGKPVQFLIAGDPGGAKTGTTGADGVATVTFASKALASAKPLTVTASFPGDATDGKAKVTGTILISQEKTAFAAPKVAKTSATARTVTATLLDDDKKPVVGQKVDFLVNGKKAGTVVTNSKGQAVFKGAKAGQTVQTKFAAVAGKYLGAQSAKYKV